MIPAILAVLAAVTLTPANSSCQPIAGADPLAIDRDLRWLIIGEQHGTAETAPLFTDLICLLAVSGRTIVVALEYPVDQQAQIDAFLASDGKEEARAAFLSSPMWHEKMQDGRSSKAMFGLFERLRQLKTAKRIDRVVAFMPVSITDTQPYELAMADRMKRASPTADALVVALVGNTHARTAKWTWNAQSYMPMAGLLPKLQTVTLNAIGNGGAQWACFFASTSSAHLPPTCGARDFGLSPRPQARSIILTREPNAPYSGMLYLGVPTTASPPAVSN